MTILLSIGIGLHTIVTLQMKTIREMGDSVLAFHAADTGIEKALYCLYKRRCEGCSRNTLPFVCSGNVGQASYFVEALQAGDTKCPKPQNLYYCLKSTGTYKETRRAIEASY